MTQMRNTLSFAVKPLSSGKDRMVKSSIPDGARAAVYIVARCCRATAFPFSYTLISLCAHCSLGLPAAFPHGGPHEHIPAGPTVVLAAAVLSLPLAVPSLHLGGTRWCHRVWLYNSPLHLIARLRNKLNQVSQKSHER